MAQATTPNRTAVRDRGLRACSNLYVAIGVCAGLSEISPWGFAYVCVRDAAPLGPYRLRRRWGHFFISQFSVS